MKRTEPSGNSGAQTFCDHLLTWLELIEQCGRKPTRKRVHALRVVTLRIQAEMEYALAELPRASHQAQAMLRFGKLGQNLRQALGRVRELDVWIGKLQVLRESLGEAKVYVPRSTQQTISQIELLEERLIKKRRIASQKLVEKIEKRREKLMEMANELKGIARDWTYKPDENEAARIVSGFAKVASEFPSFDEQNLHDFRKKIKKVRYLAELHHDDPVCGRIATQVRRAQNAIGEWHDWHVLAWRATKRTNARFRELAELFEDLAAEAFVAANTVCHSVTAQTAEQNAVREPDRRPGRMGPARNEGPGVAAIKKLA